MAASSDPSRYAVAKLNNQNYQLWKFKIEMLLSKDDLWEIVEKGRITPALEDFEKRNRQAKATISLAVEDDQLVHIRKEETAKGMWEALKKVHEQKNITSKLYLLRKIHQMRYQNGQDMQQHITSLLETADLLRGFGEEVKDSYVACMLLCSLPENYGPLITALETRPDTELTLEYVRMKILDEYTRRKELSMENRGNDDEQAVLKTQNNGAMRRETRECYYCKKPGHLKQDCRKLKYMNQQNTNSSVNSQRSKITTNDDAGELLFAVGNAQKNQDFWYIDSGATSHMTSDKNFFSILVEKSDNIYLADQSVIKSEGIGEGAIKCCLSSGEVKNIVAKDVLYVPTLEGSLLSVKKLTNRGHTVIFEKDGCYIKHGNKIMAEGFAENTLYRLSCNEIVKAAMSNKSHDNCIHLWHRRMGHRDPNAIKKLNMMDLADGISLSNCNELITCECCIQGKMTRLPFSKDERRSSKPLELIVSDLCGPMRTKTFGGKTYMLTFIDDYSRFTFVYLLSRKDQVLGKFKEFIATVSNRFNRKPCSIRTDNGGEYIGNDIEAYFRMEGIEHELIPAYTPEHNGIAERKNRSLVEMGKCMLLEAQLSRGYWGEAVMTATYLQNRLPSRSIDKTPYELWYGSKPRVGHIKVFGSKAYVHVPKEKRTKWDDKASIGILIGFSTATKGYKILDPTTKKVILSRNVRFDESIQIGGNTVTPTGNLLLRSLPESTEKSNEIIVTLESEGEQLKPCEPDEATQSSDGDQRSEIDFYDANATVEDAGLTARCSERGNKGKPPNRYPKPEFGYLVKTNFDDEPQSWDEVMNLDEDEKEKWAIAANEEIESLKKRGTWELTELPKGRKAIGCKWVFKSKYNNVSNTHQYKARLVAKGYCQKFGEDYDETFAPVVRYETIRILFCIAAQRKMYVEHLDVKTAFLYGDITEDLYMKQPPGYSEKGKENLVCKLRHSIYGLKQSARMWNQKMNSTLINKGFQRSAADPGLYSRMEKDGSYTYIIVYVDDILICTENHSTISVIQAILNEHFEMKNLGKASQYLGIQVKQTDDGSYILYQGAKIQQILEKYGMENSKPVKTPMETQYLKLEDNSKELPDNSLYREIMGSLLYLATVSRPDISAAISILCRKVSHPRECDWKAVKRVLRYLRGTDEMGLQFSSNSQPELVGFVDADWAGDTSDRKSTSGYLFKLGTGAIAWTSKKQTTIALSTTEAEYVAAAHATQELMWIRQLLKDMGLEQNQATQLYEDNQGCIKLSQSEKTNFRTRHIDIKYHLLREQQELGILALLYCPTEEMTADILTKPLDYPRFQHLRDNTGLVSQGSDIEKG